MALDILELRKLCIPKNIRITLHAAKRLEQRRIFLKDVIACIMNGEIIEQYPDDYPLKDKPEADDEDSADGTLPELTEPDPWFVESADIQRATYSCYEMINGWG